MYDIRIEGSTDTELEAFLLLLKSNGYSWDSCDSGILKNVCKSLYPANFDPIGDIGEDRDNYYALYGYDPQGETE
jgi:hypothetical protein